MPPLTAEQRAIQERRIQNENVAAALGWTKCTCGDPHCGAWFPPNSQEWQLGVPEFSLRVAFSDEDLPWEITAGCAPSIFLAGPTRRGGNFNASWRQEAVRILTQKGYRGIVLIPERRSWVEGFDYVDQVHWEMDALGGASRIFFWVPRHLPEMPALTTNVEFGYWVSRRPEKVAYGRPEGAEHTRYLDWLYRRECQREPTGTLNDTLNAALTLSIREIPLP